MLHSNNVFSVAAACVSPSAGLDGFDYVVFVLWHKGTNSRSSFTMRCNHIDFAFLSKGHRWLP